MNSLDTSTFKITSVKQHVVFDGLYFKLTQFNNEMKTTVYDITDNIYMYFNVSVRFKLN